MNQVLRNVSTAGDLCPLGVFILSLSYDPEKRAAWIEDRATVIKNSGLSRRDKAALVSNDPTVVRDTIVSESGGAGSRIWICVWIK